ncbi:glycine cleavage system H-protein [Tieghemostelium lacteum]|uniref:Glycine cleavage system H protein n=1 Tax=Tieghemostelium lacteum TaxID=361077 RepID=A0A151Z9J1_TIELA|nr:glycine cleavage system H-protein [Tieghemostelium lacteum]|eukprot:KYQ90620.1 glycine cleavage system H-protein [Tieghemostelium lacteum]
MLSRTILRSINQSRSLYSIRCYSTGSNIRFTKEHEWIRLDQDVGTVGITDHAQKELGDIVYVDLPKVGATFKKSSAVATVESTKAASDIYSPVSGIIVDVNKDLESAPELINEGPLDKGWIFKLKLTDKSEFDTLLSKADYDKIAENH